MEKSEFQIDLNAYFQRICYQGERSPTLNTLRAIHLQHPLTISFENINALLQISVPLDLTSLQKKLIHNGRGGYCFEQNLLLQAVLIALGYKVTGLAARVLWNRPDGNTGPRTHMLLKIDIDSKNYIADVGFGELTLTAPLSLEPDIEQNTPHGSFRFVSDGTFYTLQILHREVWKSLYSFDLHEQLLSDYEVSNWYVSTRPKSLFTTTLVLGRPSLDCRYSLWDNHLKTYYLDGRVEHRILFTVPELFSVFHDIFLLDLRMSYMQNHIFQKIVSKT